MGGGFVFVPGSLTRRPSSLSGQTQSLKVSEDHLPAPRPPSKQAGTSTLLHRHVIATWRKQVERFPQKTHSVHSNIGTGPAPSINPSAPPPKRLLPLSLSHSPGGQSANRRHSQCTHAHLRQFCKVPVYLLSGRCPQNIMHHTYKSFTLFVYLLASFFFCLFLYKSISIKKTSFPSMILYSGNRQLSERLSPKRGPAGTGFQYGAKRHALAGTHPRHSALGQFNQETGRETAFVSSFFFPLLFS